MKLFCQLVIGVSLFHELQLVHQDLKPQNIFIDDDINAVLGLMFNFVFIFSI
jgi:serine/threonine protein kinase